MQRRSSLRHPDQGGRRWSEPHRGDSSLHYIAGMEPSHGVAGDRTSSQDRSDENGVHQEAGLQGRHERGAEHHGTAEPQVDRMRGGVE